MKAKTIRATLRKKVNDWLESIDDPVVREIASKQTIVTGGSIASMLLKEPVNDYDIYFLTKDAAKAVAEYYVSRFKPKTVSGIPANICVFDDPADGLIKIVVQSAGIASEAGTAKPYQYFESSSSDVAAGEYVQDIILGGENNVDAQDDMEELAPQDDSPDKPKYRPVFLSTNAITLSGQIQIIIRFFGEADKIHENFDFVHCTNYWCSWNDELTLRQPALESLLAKELRYVGSKYPVCSVIRLRKFIKRNWTINAGQILKMLLQVSELDLTDPKVLQDQLVGVDAAYFCELMTKVKANDPDKVNSAYLVEIIDRMF